MNNKRLQRAKWKNRPLNQNKRTFGIVEVLIFLFFIALILTLFNSQDFKHREIAQGDFDCLYPPAEMSKDLSFLIETLEEVHPDLYNSISKDEVQAEVARINGALSDSMKRIEYFRLISPLISKFGDSNTFSTLPHEEWEDYKDQGALLFPLDLDFRENGVWVTHNYTNDTLVAAGREVLEINGVPTSQIYERMLNYTSGEHESIKREKLNEEIQKKLWIVYGFESPYEVTVRREIPPQRNRRFRPEPIITRTMLGVSAEKIEENQIEKSPAVPAYRYEFITNRNTGLMVIPGLVDGVELRNFIGESFVDLMDNESDNIILDFRGCSSIDKAAARIVIGSFVRNPYTRVSREEIKVSKQIKRYLTSKLEWYQKWYPSLFSDFHADLSKTEIGGIAVFDQEVVPAPQNRLKFRGDLYVLIDDKVSGSASDIATILKDYGIATIIGTETAGHPTFYGETYLFDLPKSHLVFGASSKRYVRPSGVIGSGGLKPDLEVIPTEYQITRNIDATLEAARQLIREKFLANQ
jgi:Peptidase family S41